jgi:hypothetical protein
MVVNGEQHIGDAFGLKAVIDTQAAYDYYSSLTSTGLIVGDIAGGVFTPGVYFGGAAVTMSGNITLDGRGFRPDALFVFHINAAFAVAALVQVTLIGCRPDQVLWVCTGAPAIGAGAVMAGTIISIAAVALGAGVRLKGRLLSCAGAASTDGNAIT